MTENENSNECFPYDENAGTPPARMAIKSKARQRAVFGTEKTNTHKRQMSNKSDLSMNLICPITLALPYHPVTAADGRIYERSAIEQHFATRQSRGLSLTSPVTGEVLESDKLLPSHTLKSHIEDLIVSGYISGGLADDWKDKDTKTKLLQKAEKGDMDALHNIGLCYMYGSAGFEKNEALAFHWLEKAHAIGCAESTVALGDCYFKGLGVRQNKATALLYFSMVADRSDLAAFHLGQAFAFGSGAPRKPTEAIKWIKKTLGPCEFEHLRKSEVVKARAILEELTSQLLR